MATAVLPLFAELLENRPSIHKDESLELAELCANYPLVAKCVVKKLRASSLADVATMLQACAVPGFLVVANAEVLRILDDFNELEGLLQAGEDACRLQACLAEFAISVCGFARLFADTGATTALIAAVSKCFSDDYVILSLAPDAVPRLLRSVLALTKHDALAAFASQLTAALAAASLWGHRRPSMLKDIEYISTALASSLLHSDGDAEFWLSWLTLAMQQSSDWQQVR